MFRFFLTVRTLYNHYILKVRKAKEVVVELRREHSQHPSPSIYDNNNIITESMTSIKLLRVYISEDLSWTTNPLSLQNHQESILTSRIIVRYSICTKSCRKTLQHIMRAAEKIISDPLSSVIDNYTNCLTHKAIRIVLQSYSLFSLQAITSRLLDNQETQLHTCPASSAPPYHRLTHNCMPPLCIFKILHPSSFFPGTMLWNNLALNHHQRLGSVVHPSMIRAHSIRHH